jgi:hypothetical protein
MRNIGISNIKISIISSSVNPLNHKVAKRVDFKRRIEHSITVDFYLTPLFFYVYIANLLLFREALVRPCKKPSAKSTRASFAREFARGYIYNLKNNRPLRKKL